jgi:hypothetical protein
MAHLDKIRKKRGSKLLAVFGLLLLTPIVSAQITDPVFCPSTTNTGVFDQSITATTAYLGDAASGNFSVWYGCGPEVIDKPFIYIEGIDFTSAIGLNAYPSFDPVLVCNGVNTILRDLRADGFDIIQLDFDENPQFIQRNAFLVVALLEEIQAQMNNANSKHEIVIMGESMGSMIIQYALAWMESVGQEHNVKEYISFDAQHQGANVPWGLQYMLQHLSLGNLTTAFVTSSALDLLFLGLTDTDSYEAAFQLLRDGPIPIANLMRFQFVNDLSSLTVDGYPQNCRKLAISNGSNNGTLQATIPNDPLLELRTLSIPSALALITAGIPPSLLTQIHRAYAAPGRNDLLLLPPRVVYTKQFELGFDLTVLANHLPPTIGDWDTAPGGLFDLIDNDNFFVSSQPFSFVPLVSALDLDVADPNFAVNTVAGFSSIMPNTGYTFNDPITPFEVIYAEPANSQHVFDFQLPGFTDILRSEISPVHLFVQDRIVDDGKAFEAREIVTLGANETATYPIGEVNFLNTSDVDVRAGIEIEMKPGFSTAAGSSASFVINPFDCN